MVLLYKYEGKIIVEPVKWATNKIFVTSILVKYLVTFRGVIKNFALQVR